MDGRKWEVELSHIKDSVVFIDEHNDFIRSTDFARAIKESDNYYVIISRDSLHSLPYSVNEIYGFRSLGKTNKNEPVYNEQYRIYSKYGNNSRILPEKVITEDSNAGYEFFKHICDEFNIECISANGRDNIVKYIQNDGKRTLIIADGAAYGHSMRKTMDLISYNTNNIIYLPESFEWLILKANLFRSSDVDKILSNPSDYIESQDYFSWERYFTDLLYKISLADNRVPTYSKNGKLSEFYKNTVNSQKILNEMKLIEFK